MVGICNGENKTKNDENTLVNTIDNLFCSVIINDDALHCVILLLSFSVFEFSKIVCRYLSGDKGGEWVRRINDKW